MKPPKTNKSSNKDKIIRKKKRYSTAKNYKKLKIVLFVIGILLGLITLAIVTIFVINCSGKNSIENSKPDITEGKIVEYGGNTYKYNENIVTMLMIGYDQNLIDEKNGVSGQADFIMLFALDTETGKIKALSIPRDTMVEAAQYAGQGYIGLDKKMQIALSYAYGDGGTKSCENTKDSVSRLIFNMPINKYLALNLEGIAPINDSVGGVLVNALESIPGTTIQKGYDVRLLGNNARKYVQYRDKNDTYSSENRRKRQSQYLQTFFRDSVMKSDNIPSTVINLFVTASQYITTNIGLDEVTYLGQVLLAKHSTLQQINTVPGYYSTNNNLVEYNVDNTKLYEQILDIYYVKQ